MTNEMFQDLDVKNSINAKAIGADLLAAIKQAVFDMEHPVGDVQEQRPNEPTPAEKYGMGTWTLDTTHNGRTEIGASDDYPLGSTGGSADAVVVEHGYHLYGTEAWLQHGNANGIYLNTSNMSSYQESPRGWNISYGSEVYPAGENVGESGTGKNMQPYLAINYWKRVA